MKCLFHRNPTDPACTSGPGGGLLTTSAWHRRERRTGGSRRGVDATARDVGQQPLDLIEARGMRLRRPDAHRILFAATSALEQALTHGFLVEAGGYRPALWPVS